MKPPLKRRVPKLRNPCVALARRAGKHEQTGGAGRPAGKQALKQSLAAQ